MVAAAPVTTTIRPSTEGLVATVVGGQIANHLLRGHPYRVGREGGLFILPGSGGITLNRRVGDRALGLRGDHVEPGVSIRNNDRESVGGRDAPNRALLALSCIGNVARVITGAAAGATGVVTGKHGGINHVLIDFSPAVLRRLRLGDRIQVEAWGQGMTLPGVPDTTCLNLSPQLLRRWGIRRHGRHLHVPVTHVIPAGLLGSGLGRSDGVLGDCDVQLSEPEVRRRYRLDHLRLGDLVALRPVDFSFGPSRQADRVTFGVVVHSDSHVAGHGPGVTPLLCGPVATLRPSFSPTANLARVLGLRERLAPLPAPSEAERRAAWGRQAPVEAAPTPAAPCTCGACG